MSPPLAPRQDVHIAHVVVVWEGVWLLKGDNVEQPFSFYIAARIEGGCYIAARVEGGCPVRREAAGQLARGRRDLSVTLELRI